MSPKVRRETPPYMQIADDILKRIKRGELAVGDRVPSIRALATEYGVAEPTAAKAMGHLQAGGAVWTDGARGTFVAAKNLTGVPVRGQNARPDVVQIVTAAALVPCPKIPAQALGLDPEPGLQVVRREWIDAAPDIDLGGTRVPIRLSVTWHPSQFWDLVSEFRERLALPTEPVDLIARETGRYPTYAHQYYQARESDTREATALELPVRTPVLAQTRVLADGESCLEYREWCDRPGLSDEYVSMIEPG